MAGTTAAFMVGTTAGMVGTDKFGLADGLSQGSKRSFRPFYLYGLR
jgi:hypothetical protein